MGLERCNAVDCGWKKLTATRQQKKPSEELICSWISEAWNSIPPEMVSASFLKCGITNNLDATDYNMVYNAPDDNEELDESFIRELFQSHSESDFKGFIV